VLNFPKGLENPALEQANISIDKRQRWLNIFFEIGMTINDDSNIHIKDGQCKFAKPEFWKRRFENNAKPFDWYCTMRELEEPLLHIFRSRTVSNSSHVLNVGCGNSTFSADIVKVFSHCVVTNVDIVAEIIDRMKIQYPSQDWIVGDATELTSFLEKSMFDIVIDKGTMDALLCDPLNSPKADLLLLEMANVLQAEGLLLVVSHKPDRKPRIEQTHTLRVDLVWKCDLSDEAMLINSFRSRGVNEEHLREFKSIPDHLLVDSIQDWRNSVKSKVTRKAIRSFLLSRNMQAAATRSSIIYDRDFPQNSSIPEELIRTNTRSDFCYLYVITKN